LTLSARNAIRGEHSREEIDFLISGYTRGEIPDYQMAAWPMATWIRGLSGAEIASLTEAMLHSGEVITFPELPAKKVDKHSTGGIGDKTSLILAPIVAAGGLNVPMISGRGLGHTGGTLDKLEAIPGFNTALTLADFRRVLRDCGMALIGQTAEIAPADKKIYALRDVTSTVENVGLMPPIAGKILPKESTRWCSTSKPAPAPSCKKKTRPPSRADGRNRQTQSRCGRPHHDMDQPSAVSLATPTKSWSPSVLKGQAPPTSRSQY
jgi:thymidine phosphorylase